MEKQFGAKTERKIFLNRREIYKKLSESLEVVSSRINQELKTFAGGEELLDSNLRVKMDCFGGEEIKSDLKLVEDREKSFAPDFDNQKVQENFKANTPEQALAGWQEEKARSQSNLRELAITYLLTKKFQDKYIVVRSAKYDDYENGVDNLIMDKDGHVVCTFDETIDKKGSDRTKDKEKKIIRKAQKGGITIRYGFTIKDGKLSKGEIRNIPGFNLKLSSQDTKELLAGLEYDPDKSLSDTEEKIFTALMTDLEEQRKLLLKNLDTESRDPKVRAVRKNLENFPRFT